MRSVDLNKDTIEFQSLAAVTLSQLQLCLAVEGLGDAFSWLLYQVPKSQVPKKNAIKLHSFYSQCFPEK